MGYKVFGDTIVMRIDPGAEILKTVTECCEKENITGAYITGVGATGYCRIAAGDELKGEYCSSEYNEKMEIIHLTGDVTVVNEKPSVHIHVTLAGRGGVEVHGGHLEEGVIFSNCEIIITKIPGAVLKKRPYPEFHNWMLLDF